MRARRRCRPGIRNFRLSRSRPFGLRNTRGIARQPADRAAGHERAARSTSSRLSPDGLNPARPCSRLAATIRVGMDYLPQDLRKRHGMKTDLNAELLRELLDYHPETGRFYWRVRRGSASVGTEAGSWHSHGYRVIMINGRSFYAHRLAWLHVHGKHPAGVIDHKNHDRSDNRIVNLEDRPPAANAGNRQKRSRSGFPGVVRRGSRWAAVISINRQRLRLGIFDSPVKAAARYQRAARLIHGRLATGEDRNSPGRSRQPRPGSTHRSHSSAGEGGTGAS
jgi:HNH endonuclease